MKHRKATSLLIPAVFLLIATYYIHLTRYQNRDKLWRTWADPSPTWPDMLDSLSTPIPTPRPSPAPLWPGKNATKTLVVARLQEDDTSWVDAVVQADTDLTSAVYTVDNHTAALNVPTNKGHEVMVYLTYIIDHYDHLNDVTMFMHAHQISWHNNDFLDSDSAKMVERLRPGHVIRNGYMNMRCHHQPGCPDHIHPVVDNATEDDIIEIPEAAVIGTSWVELFPADPLPRVLSQPCCAQFAVSAEQIRRIPRRRYLDYREWVLHTELEDRLSGRVWEYIWQWLFTGYEEVCPAETTCYCEGYGLCFDPAEYDLYFKNREEARKLEGEVEDMGDSDEKFGDLKKRIDALHEEMDGFKAKVKG